MIKWRSLDSESELEEALSNDDIYPAFVIPRDLSSAQQSGREAAEKAVREGMDVAAAQAVAEALVEIASDSTHAGERVLVTKPDRTR